MQRTEHDMTTTATILSPMQATHIVTTYHRNGQECTECVLIEVCKPRSKHDDETHRVQMIGGRIIRVRPSQLRLI
jgi:hypothetical protein